MMKKNTIYILPIVLLVLLSACAGKKQNNYIYNQGSVFGTYYTITYLQPKGLDLQTKIEAKFDEFDLSLSTFNPESIISKINRNVAGVITDQYFEEMYNMARIVSEKTDGAFDITVASLVNAWGFGFGNHEHKTEPDVKAIMPFIGYKKIDIRNNRLMKTDNRIMLDASAIAKGQSCDVIARLLEENGCKNFMIEIGGEVYCKGKNPKGEKWHIGIDKPGDDPANENNDLQTILAITDVGMATSGNYRQYYYLNGKKYAHTIDPRSGFPINHSLLSATVIAQTCMQADAYATAFMVLGVKRSLEICKADPNVECYLISSSSNGNLKIDYSPGFEKYLSKE